MNLIIVSAVIVASTHSATIENISMRNKKSIILRHNVIQSQSQSSQKKAPVVILHGLLGSARNLQTFAKTLFKSLRNEHDVIVLDARNHGRSIMDNEDNLPMSYEDMVGDLQITLDKLNIQECHLIGHSMGGKTAAAGALDLNFRNKILSIVVMDISPIAYESSEFVDVLETVQLCSAVSNDLRNMKTKQEITEYLSSKVDNPSSLAFLMSNIEAIFPSGFAWKFRIHGIRHSLHHIQSFPYSLDNIPNIPYGGHTLILKASDSRFIRSSHLETIRTFFPNFQLVSIRGAGHNLHIDKPIETVDIISTFYSSL